METYKVKTPVIFAVFNRYENAMQVFERIKQVKPSKLYVIADGPRQGHPTDAQNCQKVRSIFEDIDWDCEVFKNFAESNIGCGTRLFTGFSWVFQQEERAIILEDDCVPDLTFFPYGDELLEKYKDDQRIAVISGDNINTEWKKGDCSYHFTKYGGIHGWATWRRVWNKMDMDMRLWQNPHIRELFKRKVGPWFFYFLSKAYNDLAHRGKDVYAWDYQFGFSQIINSGLEIIPSTNLVTNIGFGEGATNTYDEQSKAANVKVIPMKFPLVHPPAIIEDDEYDKLLVSVLYPKTARILISYLIHEVLRYSQKFFPVSFRGLTKLLRHR